jgi:hypothetical protein
MANSVKVTGVVRVGVKRVYLTGPYRATEERAVQAFYKLYVKSGYFKYQVVNLKFVKSFGREQVSKETSYELLDSKDRQRVHTMAKHAGVWLTEVPPDGIGARW